jgi:hypothetical protein
MNRWIDASPSFKNIKKTLRYAEWIVIFLMIPVRLFTGEFNLQMFVFLMAFIVMSCFFPINRPYYLIRAC